MVIKHHRVERVRDLDRVLEYQFKEIDDGQMAQMEKHYEKVLTAS
jgi:hypothetical protein